MPRHSYLTRVALEGLAACRLALTEIRGDFRLALSLQQQLRWDETRCCVPVLRPTSLGNVYVDCSEAVPRALYQKHIRWRASLIISPSHCDPYGMASQPRRSCTRTSTGWSAPRDTVFARTRACVNADGTVVPVVVMNNGSPMIDYANKSQIKQRTRTCQRTFAWEANVRSQSQYRRPIHYRRRRWLRSQMG